MKMRIALALILLAALTRLFPHPHNFTPLGAIGLFGAAYFQRRWLAFAVPFGALFLSDLLINNLIYSDLFNHFVWAGSAWIYLSFACVISIGLLAFRQQINPKQIVAASLLASAGFFLVSNFSVWVESGMYPKTFAGLTACYAAGLPFLGNTVLGDLFFSGVLFGGYSWILQRSVQPASGM